MNRRFLIKTYGCQMNEHDSEVMAAILIRAGFQAAENEENADVIILNTCSVREQAERKAIGKLHRFAKRKMRRENFHFGICGCMAQNLGKDLFRSIPSLSFMIGPRHIHAIADVLSRLENHETQILLLDDVAEESALVGEPCHRKSNDASALVTIANGCNMNCSYCIVPKTRGRETYRPMEDILREVQHFIDHGVKEITLLGQIVNFYGIRHMPFVEGKSPFVQLLEKIHGISGLERIRFLSPHPSGFHDDLIRCYEDLPKLCPHVHLPIQSGSGRILRLMCRPYTRQTVLEIIQKLRQISPLMAISTDLIVGFPGETDEDFWDTERLFEAVDFDMAFIFKYSPRAGTAAAIMDNQVPKVILEERNQILLQKLANTSQKRNQLFLNTIQPVLVEYSSAKDQHIYVGYTVHHKKVFFPASADMLGQIVDVKITQATTSGLRGILVSG
jgi:tRNA-2-methylthio-N6-dimethylallyladenosine synthase